MRGVARIKSILWTLAILRGCMVSCGLGRERPAIWCETLHYIVIKRIACSRSRTLTGMFLDVYHSYMFDSRYWLVGTQHFAEYISFYLLVM